jgi:hypothetical protein
MKRQWKLDDKLLKFSSKGDYFTIADACEGIQVFGGIGSGKTSGPLQIIAKAYLKHGFGGLVLCAKKEETATWIKYIQQTGREDDIIRLSESSFDFLKYESNRSDEVHVENIADIFLQIAELDAANRSSSGDGYWLRAGKQLLRNTITLLLMSNEDVTLENISKVVHSAPEKKEFLDNEKWRNSSYCYSLAERVKTLEHSSDAKKDFVLAERYFFNEYPVLDPKTRSNIVSFFTTMADGFLRGKIRKIFCDGKVDLQPDMCMQGKIILVDLSLKEYREIGRYAAGILKYMTQLAIERREDISDTARPVFIFADEAHYFITSKDQEFQTTARSVRGCTVFATQNYSNYLKELKDKSTVDSLLGNLITKAFCQNGDHVTNEWAANSIGKEIITRKSTSKKAYASLIGNMHKTNSTSEQKDFILEPTNFSTLSKGKKINKYKVGCILWRSGTLWKNRQPFLKVKFDQRNQSENKSNDVYTYCLYGLAALSALILSAFMLLKEPGNISYLIYYYTHGINHFYLQAVAIALVSGFVYLIISKISYIAIISKALLITFLLLNAGYLYMFSPLKAADTALIMNIYLIAFFCYIFSKNLSTITDREWNTPVITEV